MVRPALAVLPSPDLPPGIDARPAAPASALQILRAMNEAMADHWGMASYTDDDMAPWTLHPLYGQLDVWQVAWEGDEVVGGVLGFVNAEENRLLGRARGYTECIFTRRPWRGRGIATALIGRNLRLLAERGMTEAALSVDTENPTGALALYERVGFVRDRASLICQRPV
jgi:GNAT superfamily N-acetyltransferase